MEFRIGDWDRKEETDCLGRKLVGNKIRRSPSPMNS